MELQLSNIRKEYKKDKLMRNTISENPFEQFACWLNDALHCGEDEPTAMIMATVAPDGRPSTRTVLLKGVENGRFIFYTNYESRKGQQLADNPYPSSGISWKGRYILKAKQKSALQKTRTPTSPPAPTKAK